MTDNFYGFAFYAPEYLYDWIKRPGYIEQFPNELEGDLKMPNRLWDAEDYDARFGNWRYEK